MFLLLRFVTASLAVVADLVPMRILMAYLPEMKTHPKGSKIGNFAVTGIAILAPLLSNEKKALIEFGCSKSE